MKKFIYFFLIICIFLVNPLQSLAGVYSFTDLGSVSFDSSKYVSIYLAPGQTKLVTAYDITPPNGTPTMRIQGSMRLDDTQWQYGIVSGEGYIATFKIFGKRADGSLGECVTLQWHNWTSEGTPKSFDTIFNENYPKFYLEFYMYYYGDDNTLQYYTYSGSMNCFSGIYHADKVEIDNMMLNVQNAANNALNAYNAANTASANASSAKTSADTAASRAQTTINQTWYSGKYGGTSESTADIAGYIRNQQLPTVINNTTYNSQSAAYWAYQAAQNATPTISKVQGQNGATCTTGSTFTVVISATPSSGARYRVTCGSFDSGWVSNNTITINRGIVSGANTATVQVKNAAGTTAQTTFTFFKI